MVRNQKLNVTFENGKTIIEGTPALLYINCNGYGVGQLYKNGEQLTHLIKIDIHAEINNQTTYDVKFATKQEGK